MGSLIYRILLWLIAVPFSVLDLFVWFDNCLVMLVCCDCLLLMSLLTCLVVACFCFGFRYWLFALSFLLVGLFCLWVVYESCLLVVLVYFDLVLSW